ncbi:MAG: alpha/beta fold hydrolase [Thermodesulfobacteriota bacterium]
MKFWSEVLHHENPDWSSPNETEWETDAFVLRRFSRSGKTRKALPPILVSPPQAGHHSCIADYEAPHQSLIRTCLDYTENEVYAIEWKSATHARRNDDIARLIDYLNACVERIGSSVHLIGLCQGGWLSAMYTALFPNQVESLLLGAAPVDFTAGGGKLQEMVQSTPMSFYAGLVAAGGGVLWGGHMLLGWKMMNFYDRFCGDYLNIWRNLKNDEFLRRNRKFKAWYDTTQDISGAWYLQAVKELFKDNKLVKKQFAIRDRIVDLGHIRCPVALLVGETDDITLPPQLFNMAQHIATPSGEVYKAVIPGCGHIGTFMGKTAQGYWVEAFRFISAALENKSDSKAVSLSA